jgi:CRP/FNR family cyclic AMP-dependent transcriptional regulator
MAPTTELLRNVSIFSGLPTAELQELTRRLIPRKVSKDELILAEEEPGDSLFIIVSGKVKVTLSSERGREVILSVLGPGEVFGEMAILDGEPRSARVTAQAAGFLYQLSREALVDYVQRSPKAALNMLTVLCRRLRRADEVIGNLALLDVYGRVAHVLLDLARKEGVAREDGILISNRPTQHDLAAMIGTSRETVSRALNEFARSGYITLMGRRILVRHSAMLQEAYPR